MSDESMKEIANLQIFAARLFEGEEYLMKGIRMTLKRKPYEMNYRHVLDMHKYLLKKF